jgi:serine/threonine protein kinase
MSDYTGQQFGNYRLVKLLGRGGFAEVYEGEHVYLQTRAAIKILHAKLADSERIGFLNEAQTIARLQHEHIVRVLEFDVREDTPFLVMEYAPGGTLREHFPRGEAVPPEQILPAVQQISAALQYAHEQRLVHRDVKPDNMLLGAENEVLLSDFGIALLLQSTRMSSQVHDVVGTAAYMAPEQIRGQPLPASDQYALAIAVYEWLCGERPFQGTSFASLASQHLLSSPPPLRSKAPHLPLAVEEVVHKALAKDPQQRFVSVRDFALALSYAIGDPTTSGPDSARVSGSRDAASIMNEMGQERTQYRTPETVAAIGATVAAQPLVTQHVLTMTQPAPPKRRGVSLRMSILLGIVALLVLGGVIVHLFSSQTSTIPVVQKDLSSSSQKQGVQDYQKLYLQATSGLPIIEDPLTMPDGLDWLKSARQACHFSGGALHLQLRPGRNADACLTTNFGASDYAYQVKMTLNVGKKVANKVPAAGIFFRYGAIGTYFMDVTVDGSCEFGTAKILSGLSYLIRRSGCPAPHTGYHQANLLTVIARGPNIYLYVNKQFVGSRSDSSFTSGQVGVFAAYGALDTSFQDARVWNLG